MSRILTEKDFFFSVRNGDFTGLTARLFGGQNPGVSADNEEGVNNIRLETGTGEIYTYLTTDTTLFASSTDATESVILAVLGLDSLFNSITRLVTLNGQTPVALSGTMFRIISLFVISGVTNKGNIYISTDDLDITAGIPNTLSKVKTKMDAGTGQGNLAAFTVGKDTKSYFYNLEIANSKVADIDMLVRFKFVGDTDFNTGPPFQIFQSGVGFFGSTGFNLPEGTDIDFTVKSPTSGSKLTLQLFVIDIDV